MSFSSESLPKVVIEANEDGGFNLKRDTISKEKLTTGTKYDGQKLRMDLLPVEATKGLAEVLTMGAEKYEEYNWAKGMDWHRPYAAAQRHLTAWWSGESIDKESKLNHLKHALCNLAFLLAYEERNIGKDDRPKLQGMPDTTLNDSYEYQNGKRCVR